MHERQGSTGCEVFWALAFDGLVIIAVFS